MNIITIRIIGRNGTELFSGFVTELPLREEYVISKSIERFNESEPCIIYRTYVGKMLYLELYEKLDYLKKSKFNKITCSEVSNFFDNINLDTQGASIFID